MLLAQVFLNSFAVVVQAVTADAATKENNNILSSEVIYLDDNEKEVNWEEHTGGLAAEIKWTLEGQDVTQELSDQLQLDKRAQFDEQKGDLTAENGDDVGDYHLNTDGILSVTFNEGIESDSVEKGVIRVEGMVNVKVPETQFAGEKTGGEDTVVADETGESEENDDPDPAGEEMPTMGLFAEIESNIISSFQLTLIDKDGTKFEIEDGSNPEVNIADMNGIELVYSLVKPDDLIITAGDTYTIDLPSIYESFGAHDVPIMVDGVVLGTYSTENGQLIITFNSEVNDLDDVEMYVKLQGTLDASDFDDGDDVVIEVPFRDGTSYTVTIHPEQEKFEGTDKKIAGSPYVMNEAGEKVSVDRNPEFVDWTVRVNDSMGSFDNATVIDDLGELLSIKEGSFIVERIVRNYKNEEIGREVIDVTPNLTANGFKLELGAIEDAYDITYTTTVDRPDGGGTHTINNNARIVLDGAETPVSDEFDGTWSGDIPTITKDGKTTGDPHVIDWEVEYNFGKEDLGRITLIDELSHGEVDVETIKVYQVDTDIDGNIVGERTPVTFETGNADGNVTIEGLDANGKAYFITFSSSVPVGLQDTIINTISDDMPNPNSDNASVRVDTMPTGTKVGEQSVDESGRPYIDWTITLNSDRYNVPSAEARDVFSATHLEFDIENDELYRLTKDGEEATNFTIVPYEHDDGRTGFHLVVNEAGPHEYKFVYRTYYTLLGLQEEELANEAELVFLDSDGVGIGEAIHQKPTIAGPQAGIVKNGQYVRRENDTVQEIEWTVTFNTTNTNLVNPKIEDVFTSENISFIDGSLEMTENGVNFTDFELTKTANGFTIDINKETTAAYTIKYRTTVDTSENKEQTNTATLKWQGRDQSASDTVKKRDVDLKKEGNVRVNDNGTKSILWTVNFNSNRNVINDFKLIDQYFPASVDVSNIKIIAENEVVTNDFIITHGTQNDRINPGASGNAAYGEFTVTTDKLNAVPYVMTYETTLSAEEEAQLIRNDIAISYTGGSNSDGYKVNSPILGVQKEALSIDKETEPNRINWRITANTDTTNYLVNLVKPVLTDTIPVDQRLVEGSIVVTRVSDGADITDPSIIDKKSNTFTINLPDGLVQYTVTFQTEILEFPSVNEKIDRYTNATTLSADYHKPASDEAYIDYFADGTNNNNTKVGVINNETEDIDWNATLNPLGLTINKAIITDTLNEHQTYVIDTEGNHNIVVKNSEGELVEGEDYTLEMTNENRMFTIEFNGPINYAVDVSYSTRLNPDLIGFYQAKNDIKLVGSESKKDLSDNSQELDVSQWSYGGGGSGRTVEFTLEKLHQDGETPIPGATFEFIRLTASGTEIPVDNIVTTGDEGQFLIEGARAGRYIVRETSVPEGYQQLMDPFHIIIGYSTPEEAAASGNAYKVTVTDSSWNPITNTNIASAVGNTLSVYNGSERGEISARKHWGGAVQGNYPETHFKLYRQLPGGIAEVVPGAPVIRLASNAQTETVTWQNIELYSPEAVAYEFSVKEVDTSGNDFRPDGYIKQESDLTVLNIPVEPFSIRATKELTGRAQNAGEFTFELRDKQDNLVAEALNRSNGSIRFDVSLTEDQRNELQANSFLILNYTLLETDTELNGVTYDNAEFDVNISISVNPTTGMLDTRVVYPEEPIFTNTYKPAAGSTQLTARKILNGQSLSDSQFTFNLLANDEVIDTKTNDGDGDVTFDALSFDKVGTYYYQIEEVNNNLGGVAYDTRTFSVAVEVTDNLDGQLIVTPQYLNGPATFTNTYTPAPDSIVFEAKKILYGQKLSAGQFEFELLEGNTVLQTETNNAEGQIIFDALTYEAVGNHTYTIREVKGSQGGVIYDDSEYTIEVTVTDDGEGQLRATMTYVEDALVFENTYTPEPDTAVFEAYKVLEGQTLVADQFSFELVDAEDNVIETVGNNANGQVIFTAISYNEVGSHTYRIREDAGVQGGVIYDETEFEVTVVVTDNGVGNLSAKVEYTNGPAHFTNIYESQPDSVVLEASKVLEGQDLRNGQFTFELLNEQGHVIERVSNNGEGQVIFTELNYTKVGNHTYTIREVEGVQGGIIYDTSEFTVEVEVTDNGQGQLSATETYVGSQAVFTNTYEPDSDTLVFEAMKVLEGLDLVADQFTFELVDVDGNVVETVSNNARGQIIFTGLTYEEIGSHSYTIREVEGTQAGITYDKSEINLKVEVTDDGEGQLTAKVSYESPLVFTNNYTPAPDSIVLVAEKVLNGQVLFDDQFTFELVDESGDVVQTVTNNSDGQVVFEEITYTSVGQHTYIIREVKGNQGGMTYDRSTYTVVVNVTDDKEGQLHATANYMNGSAVFTNEYVANPDKVVLEASKVLVGQDLVADQFTFELLDASGTVMQTVTNNANGQIIFDKITYDEVGEQTYTIREVTGTQGGVTYDETEFGVIVRVIDGREGDLIATAEYTDGPASFTNTYVPAPDNVVFEAGKVLEGQDLRADQFTFELVDSAGTVIQTVSNDATGQIIFDEVIYDAVGEHTYTIREVEGTQGGVTYDKTEFEVTVVITDDGIGQLTATETYAADDVTFTNIYVPAPDSATLEAMKVLEGQELRDDQFTFDLLDEAGNVLQSKENTEDGQVTFDDLIFDTVGEYAYIIVEQKGTQGGVTYDKTQFNVIITVTDDGVGQLTATADYSDGPAVFENTYAANLTTVEFNAEKTLVGKALVAGQFNFEVLDSNNEVVAKGTNDETGNIVFEAVTFTTIGTFEFTVREVAGDDVNINYDVTEFGVTVVVTDDGEGQLHTAVNYGDIAHVFENTFKKVSVGDYVWIDENKDGLQDETDTPLEGIVLVLKDSEGNIITEDVYGNPIEPQVTDEKGYYSFDDLPINYVYTVEIDREASAEALKGLTTTIETEDDRENDSSTWTVDSIFLDEDGQRDPTLDFGFVRKVVSVGDYVWIDENRDGLQDDTDTPLEGVVLILKDEEGNIVTEDLDGNPIEPQVTDENGYYSFDNLPGDKSYIVEVDREAFEESFPGLRPTDENIGERETDSSIWTEKSVFLDEDGQRDPTLDFGFVRERVSVGDYVWVDENRDGLQDETDTPIPGVVVVIVDENGDRVKDIYGNPVEPTTTDKNGYYIFENLPIDKTYTVRIDREKSAEALKKYVPTLEEVGNDLSVDSSTWEATSEFMDVDGKHDPTLDFGFVKVEVPVEPTKPTEPTEPTKPETPTESEEEALPNSGIEDNQLLFTLIGLTLIGTGASLLLGSTRKRREN